MPSNSDLNNPDILENFDIEQFLQTTDCDFNFDSSTFEARDGFEIGSGPYILQLLGLEQSSRTESAERVMKEVKEDHEEKIIESIEREHNNSMPSSSTTAVDEADPKRPTRASLTRPDDRNKSPSLGGIHLPAEPTYKLLGKKPLLPPKDVKTLRKDLTGLPNRAEQPATDSRPQLPPIQGLGLAVDVMPPQKDNSSVIRSPPLPSDGNIVTSAGDISDHADPTFLSTKVLADRAGDIIHKHGSGLDHLAEERAEKIDYTTAVETIDCTMTGGGPEEQNASSADAFQRPPKAEHTKDDGNLKRVPAVNDLRSPPGKGMDTANELVTIPKIDEELRSAQEDAAKSGLRQRRNSRHAACTACRHQRIKCDRTRPKCVRCEQSGSECSYENGIRGQGTGPDVSSHTETDLEKPSQLPSRKANSESDLEQSTGDAAALGPNWRIVRAKSEAYREVSSLPVPPTLSNYKRPTSSDDVLDGDRLFDLQRHMTLHSGKQSHTGEHDPASNVDSTNIEPVADSDLPLRLGDSRERAPSMMEASGPSYHPSTMSPSTPARAEPREKQGAATAAARLEDPHLELNTADSVSEREQSEPWQRESEQGDSRLAEMEVADRLILLWTTVKPL